MTSNLPEAVYPHPIRAEWKMLCVLRKDNPSISNIDAAKLLGVNPNTIRLWERTPLFQSYENWFINKTFESVPLSVKRSRADVQEELDEFAQEMLSRLRDIAETSHDNKLIAQIAFDTLDRAGHGARTKDNQRPISFILTAEAVAELARRASEMRESGDVVVGQIAEGGR